MMSIEVQRATVACGTCGAQVSELRRGRCWGCFVRWSENRPVGRGAMCQVCTERRRDNLRMVELHNRSVALCHNCAARTMNLSPVPATMEEIRSILERNRRQKERRQGQRDHRIFPRERRVGDRRRAGQSRPDDVDPSIFFDAMDDLVIELADDDIEVIEQTVVRETRIGAAADND